MPRARLLHSFTTIAAMLAAAGCSSSSPAGPTATESPAPPSINAFITGVQGSDGSVGTQQAGAPPAPNGGPAVTPTAAPAVVNGNTDVVQLQGGVPFQTVYISVPNTTGSAPRIAALVNGRVTPLVAASGYFQLPLTAPTTNVLLILKLAATVTNGTTFTLAYSVATPGGAVGPPASLTKTVSGAGCAFSVSPTTVPVGAAASTASIDVAVTAGSNCAWTATTNASFVTIAQGGSGTGAGSVQLNVAANTGGARTATVIVAGIPVTITQAAGGSSTSTLLPPTPTQPVGGTVLPSDVRRPTLVVNNATSSGSDAGPVTYRFELSDLSSFPSDPARTFTVDGVPQGNGTTSWTVDRDLGPSVTWYWHARATNGSISSPYSATETFKTADPPCSIAVSPAAVGVGANADTFTLTISRSLGACGWTASFDAAWISGPTSGAPGAFAFAVAQNTGASRTGHVTISWPGGSTVVTVSQAGAAAPPTITQCAFSLTNAQGAPSTSVNGNGGAVTLSLTASPADCTWSLSVGGDTPQGMLSITSAASGTGSGTVTVAVSPSEVTRTGSVVVSAGPGRVGSASHEIDQIAFVIGTRAPGKRLEP